LIHGDERLANSKKRFKMDELGRLEKFLPKAKDIIKCRCRKCNVMNYVGFSLFQYSQNHFSILNQAVYPYVLIKTMSQHG